MKSRITHYLGHQTLLIAQIIFLLFFVQLFLIDVGRVDGTSMESTMVDQEFFFVDRLSLLFRQPHRYEVIQFFHPLRENHVVVKRIIGLPGETINIRSDKIVITQADGQELTLEEPYLSDSVRTLIKPGWNARFVIPTDSYFLLGDNRNFSVDSREFGPVHRKYITGIVNTLHMPFSDVKKR